MFTEDIGFVRERIIKIIGKVSHPSISSNTCSLTQRLIELDGERGMEYERWQIESRAPLFDTLTGKRKLRILNALFLAMQSVGCKPNINLSK